MVVLACRPSTEEAETAQARGPAWTIKKHRGGRGEYHCTWPSFIDRKLRLGEVRLCSEQLEVGFSSPLSER